MTTLFTILSLAVVAYRFKKRLVTKGERILLALWVGHYLFELAVMFGEYMFFRYEARFFRPAEFLVWFYLAWGVLELWRRVPRVKPLLVAALTLIIAYDAVLLVRANIPLGRRHAYVEACNWAAEQIRNDWKGPARDAENIFLLGEYRLPYKPVVDCHTARTAYLCGGRSNGVDDGADPNSRIAALDRPDYWIQDLRQDDPPKGDDWELMGTYKSGKYELPLYRRKR